MAGVDGLAHGPPVQHDHERRAVIAKAHGEVADLMEDASLLGVPAGCIAAGGEGLRNDARHRVVDRCDRRLPEGEDGLAGGAYVVVHEPAGRLECVVGQEVQRILADQVVEGETARPDRAQHARQRQLGEHLVCVPRIEPGDAHRSGGGDLGAGMGAQERKGARCRVRQAFV